LNPKNHDDYGIVLVQLMKPVEKAALQWNFFCKIFDVSPLKDILSFLHARSIR